MSGDFEEMFGPVVGRGAQATVFARGEYAVKLYRDGYPKANVFSEAFIMANLERADFPAPKVYEVLLAKGRYGLRMDRVKGTMIAEEFREGDPTRIKGALDVLVDLQCRLQKHDRVPWAPDLKQRFQADLERNERLPDALRKELLAELEGLPGGEALCHCDFHAENVFFDGVKHTIIDLVQLSRGDPAADAACSYLVYSYAHREVAEYYLNRYCRAAGITEEQVRQWLRVYAGTVLGQVPGEFTPVLERFIAGAENQGK